MYANLLFIILYTCTIVYIICIYTLKPTLKSKKKISCLVLFLLS